MSAVSVNEARAALGLGPLTASFPLTPEELSEKADAQARDNEGKFVEEADVKATMPGAEAEAEEATPPPPPPQLLAGEETLSAFDYEATPDPTDRWYQSRLRDFDRTRPDWSRVESAPAQDLVPGEHVMGLMRRRYEIESVVTQDGRTKVYGHQVWYHGRNRRTGQTSYRRSASALLDEVDADAPVWLAREDVEPEGRRNAPRELSGDEAVEALTAAGYDPGEAADLADHAIFTRDGQTFAVVDTPKAKAKRSLAKAEKALHSAQRMAESNPSEQAKADAAQAKVDRARLKYERAGAQADPGDEKIGHKGLDALETAVGKLPEHQATRDGKRRPFVLVLDTTVHPDLRKRTVNAVAEHGGNTMWAKPYPKASANRYGGLNHDWFMEHDFPTLFEYVINHELGHMVDSPDNDAEVRRVAREARRLGRASEGGMSNYGESHQAEAYAEAFAAWQGGNRSPVVMLYAEAFGWEDASPQPEPEPEPEVLVPAGEATEGGNPTEAVKPYELSRVTRQRYATARPSQKERPLVKQAMEGTPIISMTADSLEELVRDGRMRDRDERAPTEGRLYEYNRALLQREKQIGVPEDAPRPIYGWMKTARREENPRFGSVEVELKPEHEARMSVTFGDRGSPVWLDELGTADDALLNAAMSEDRAYTQVQVHGGVSLGDIAAVTLSPQDVAALDPAALDALAQHGIEVRVATPMVETDELREAVTESNPESVWDPVNLPERGPVSMRQITDMTNGKALEWLTGEREPEDEEATPPPPPEEDEEATPPPPPEPESETIPASELLPDDIVTHDGQPVTVTEVVTSGDTATITGQTADGQTVTWDAPADEAMALGGEPEANWRTRYEAALSRLPESRTFGRVPVTAETVPQTMKEVVDLRAHRDFMAEAEAVGYDTAQMSDEAARYAEAMVGYRSLMDSPDAIRNVAETRLSGLESALDNAVQMESRRNYSGYRDERTIQVRGADVVVPGETGEAHLAALLDLGAILNEELERRIQTRTVENPAPDSAMIAAQEQRVAEAQEKADTAAFHVGRRVIRELQDELDLVQNQLRTPTWVRRAAADDSDPEKQALAQRVVDAMDAAADEDARVRMFRNDVVQGQKFLTQLTQEAEAAETGKPQKGTAPYKQVQREEAIGLLSEVRAMGGVQDIAPKGWTDEGQAQAEEAMGLAFDALPSQWHDDIHRKSLTRPLTIEEKRRGYFRRLSWTVALSNGEVNRTGTDNPYAPVAVHELTHVAEASRPGLVESEWLMSHHRSPRDQERQTVIETFGPDDATYETTYADKWGQPYTGRVYPNEVAWEILSMGIEALMEGGPAFDRWLEAHDHEIDAEFRAYILAALAYL